MWRRKTKTEEKTAAKEVATLAATAANDISANPDYQKIRTYREIRL